MPGFSEVAISSVASQSSSIMSVMKESTVSRAVAASDFVCIVLASLASGILYHLTVAGVQGDTVQFMAVGIVFATLFCVAAQLKGLYEIGRVRKFERHIVTVLGLWLGTVVFLAFVAFCLKVGPAFSRAATLIFVLAAPVALAVVRATWGGFLDYAQDSKLFTGKPVARIVLADEDEGLPGGPEGVESDTAKYFQLGKSDNTAKFASDVCLSIRGTNIQRIIISGSWTANHTKIAEMMDAFRTLPLPIYYIPEPTTAKLLSGAHSGMATTFPICLQREPVGGFERVCKEVLEKLFALFCLVLLAPMLLVIAAAIRLESKGPAMFKQHRRGFNGRPFKIYKFRTMRVQEDGPTVVQAVQRDPRVTALGRWLRSTSVDELPQLLNVLQGQMSIVGPRPHALAHDDHYSGLINEYICRHNVKPGITGWAQINGARGETRTLADMSRRLQLDLWYIQNWSVRLDIIIAARTVFQLLRKSDAY